MVQAQELYFYPRSPCGERRQPSSKTGRRFRYFYPRSPCGERLLHYLLAALGTEFLSTLSLRRATNTSPGAKSSTPISIHALLAESDPQHEHYNPGRIPISIHALLAESDCQRVHCGRCPRNFYPRSPCGERQYDPELYTPYALISIHALLAESDTGLKSFFGTWALFLSTLSLRRATVKSFLRNGFFLISIHALLAESDAQQRKHAFERLVFLSTLSLRRATSNTL